MVSNNSSFFLVLASAVISSTATAYYIIYHHKKKCTKETSGFPALIGNTPLIRIKSLSEATGCTILAKAEFMNPGGSSKDRIALGILQDAEERGTISRDDRSTTTIVEGTSGSTGISLSLMCLARGYKCHIVMPDDQAAEKTQLLKRFGATVELVKPSSIVSPSHYVNVAREVSEKTENAFFVDQFETSANYKTHYETTGREIYEQTNGNLDAFVMSAGTGGTIAGVSTFLRSQNPNIKIYLADPPGSALYNYVMSGVCYASEQAESRVKRHRYDTVTEGIGLDRLTNNFTTAADNNIDGAFRVSDIEAIKMSRYLLRNEGLFVGASSALNCVAAVRAAKTLKKGSTVVTILCDSGTRHLTKFWNDEVLAREPWNLSTTTVATTLDLEFIK